jgi:DNA-binding NtrC family response regulator
VILLAEHFLHTLKGKGSKAKELAPEAMALLREYSWPGNIRELRNAMERAIAMARGPVITPADLPVQVQRINLRSPANAARGAAATHADALGDAEREYLASLLSKNSGNVAQSARDAGLSRQGLHKLLKKHGLDAKQYRP